MSAQGQAPNADPFDVYFRRADLDRDGRISGQEAVGFLQGSGLPKNVLAQIWMHADQNRIGFLGRAEFYNALKLVTVAQKKRELTPDIVKAALYGPASARIPPPQINLAAVPAPSLPTGTASPSMQMGTSAPPASQNPGFRGPQVPPNPILSQQYNNSSLENQLMRPPQAMSGGHASHSTHGVSGQGFPGGGTMVGPRLPNSSGALAGITSQVPNRGTGPSPAQDGIGPTVSGLTASRPPRPPTNLGLMQPETSAKDSRAPNASGNGFGADSIFGGDAFSATPAQTKQDSSAPAFSAGSLPVSSANVPVSTGTQPSVKPSPVDSLHSSLARQPGGQLQPAHSHMKPNQQASTQTTLTYPSSGVSLGAGNPASNQSHITWPKMTQSAVQKYAKVFLEVDTDRDGKITGEQARNLFLSWRLPREVLKQVWDLSDQDNDSMLSLKEFCAALYLMERYREGRPLPTVFPSSIMSDFPAIGQSTTGYNNAAWGPTSVWQQQQRTSGPGARQVTPAGGVRQPMPPQDDEGMKPKQQKSKVPVLEKHLTDQLSKEEQEALNSKFREATEADKKVEELEKEILESKAKIEYYRSKMQELVLYKSRCDNRYNEITERVSGDKREVELLAKKYEEKCRQVGDVASKLTIEEATFRDIQERKMELYQAIVKMEQDGTADGILQVRADRVQSDLDELLKSLNDRCKKYGLRVKPTALVELPFGWQPGILEGAADWDEDWDKFEDEGFAFVKELTLDVQNVVAPPKQKSTPAQKEKASPVASPTAASSPNADVKLEKPPNMDEQVHENGSASHHNEDDSVRSVPSSPAARTGTESPSRELPDSPVVQTTDGDASPHAKEESQSDHGGADSLLSGDKSFDEPTWGTFETNDDIDSVFGFNPTTKDKDHERQTDDYFFGSGDLGLNPIKTELPQTDGFFQKRSPFFDDSVPSTPLSTSGFSPPRYSQGSEHSFDLSRFDSFNMHDTGLFQPQENLSRFDSMRSTQDFDHGREFSRFDSMRSTQDFDHSRELSRFDSMRSTQDFDQGQRTFARFDSMQSNNDFDHRYDFPSFDDPFGSGGQMSFESQTPRSSDNWSESQTPRRTSDNWSESQTPRRTSDNWSESQTPRRTSDNWSAF